MRPLVLASCAWLATLSPAQSCPRPFTAGSGAPLAFEQQVAVTYSDGYVTNGTMIYPSTPAPACGWPLVVYVHRLGQGRLEDLGLVQMIADHGYAVWAYDVRGQASAMFEPGNATLPTNGTTLWGPTERVDLAEQILFVGANSAWTGLIDTGRTAVMGASQGGVHAWAAAAASGQMITVPGRGVVTFPPILCAVAADYAAEPVQDWLRGGLLWSSWFLDQIGDDAHPQPGYIIDPAFWQSSAAAFRAQDPHGLANAWSAEGRQIDAQLPMSTVPVLVSHAYHDLIDSPMPTLQLLGNLQAPTKCLLSTIGHNTPANHLEREYRDRTILRWLDRWLWQEPNGVELEPRFAMAELPLDPALRTDLDHPWSRRLGGNPLHVASAQRLWLLDDGSLADQEPAATLPALQLAQTVLDPQFTPTNYIVTAANRALPTVLAACPLAEQVFATAPLANEQQLTASAMLHLQITPDHDDWMIAALLTVQPPGGNEVMLCSQGYGRDDSQIGVATAVDLALPPVATLLPAGTIVRVRLRNLWLREAPMAHALEVAPRFHDFQLTLGLGPLAEGSWLDLPLQPVRPALVTDVQTLETAVMAPLHFTIRGGHARALSPYFVTASASGQVPGKPYQNDVLPINVDWLTGIVAVSLLNPAFQGFLGDLDVDGNANATFDLSPFAPFDPGLAGLRVTFAAYVWDYMLSPAGAATNPIDVFVK